MSAIEQKKENWKKIVRPYMAIDHRKSWWQVFNTLALLTSTWYLSYYFLEKNFLLSLFFMLICAGSHIRAFIILHDCGHGTFFKSAKLRNAVGFVMGVITLSPNKQWSREHAAHHNTSGNLDHRGRGDVWTVTVKEYEEMSTFDKLKYRLYRFPLVTFLVGPFYIFFINHRFVNPNSTRVEAVNVYWTNFAIFVLWGSMMALVGVGPFLLIEMSVLLISQIAGVFLFYAQHQFEDAYWEGDEKWSFESAGIDGSSYFELPKIFQWFTGNIGFHNIHHLCHKIPNYNLERCYRENSLFQKGAKITIWSAFKTIPLKLYDQDQRRMITYRELSKRRKSVSVFESKVA